MATRIGLEPTTPSVTGWCSNQLSYRAMIAQVRAASYRGNVLYYIEKSACCQAQICRKCNFLQKRAGWAVRRRQNDFKWSLRSATNAFSREGFRTNSLSQNLTVLPAPSGREPLARPQTLHFSRELCRHAKGPILEGAVERSETGGVLLKTKRTSSEEPVRHGRGSKFRTHGTRFWRPLLYQLSYTPICIR